MMLFMLPAGWNHCGIKTGRGIVLPGHFPQLTVGQMEEELWKP